jgi:uncharacterized heparinase superfamily protein
MTLILARSVCCSIHNCVLHVFERVCALNAYVLACGTSSYAAGMHKTSVRENKKTANSNTVAACAFVCKINRDKYLVYSTYDTNVCYCNATRGKNKKKC